MYYLAKITLFLLAPALLVGCAGERRETPAYRYTASANSAWIKGSVVEQRGVFGKEPAAAAVPYTVDGDTVEGKNYMAKGMALFDELTPVAPGRHNIGVMFSGDNKYAPVNFVLDAQPQEKYFVKMKIGWKKELFGDAASYGTLWIEDSKGQAVTPMQTANLVNSLAPNTFVFIPAVK